MPAIDYVPARAADLSDIGRLTVLTPQPTRMTDGAPPIADAYTRDPILAGEVHLGMTIALPCDTPVSHMERHSYTAEALVCAATPIVFLVAPPTPHRAAPAAADLRAVRLAPGDVLVLRPNVWHSPGLDDGAGSAYYWLADVDETVPTRWVPISGGPVHVRRGPSYSGAPVQRGRADG